MVSEGEDTSSNFQTKPKKDYIRRVCWCELDDIRITVEIPKENESI